MSTRPALDTARMPALREPVRAAPQPLRAGRERGLLIAVCALMLTACLPLARVFVGFDALPPIVGAAGVALLIDAGCRRMGLGPLVTLLIQLAGWLVFVGVVFLPDTLFAGLLPTLSTVENGRALWLQGLELIQLRPAPTYPEPGLLLLSVTGVWAVTHAVDGLVFWLAAPIAAALLGLVLWTVPLALAPPGTTPWAWAVPFLAAAAGLLLAHAGSDVERFGRWVQPDDPAGVRTRRNPLAPAGTALTAAAIVAGVLAAGVLPGYGQGPWYELRGLSGTTLTVNPIVGIQQRLVSGDTSPVLRVTTSRPVYSRVTALDIYSTDTEEWTSDSIRGGDADGELPVPLGLYDSVDVGLEVLDLEGPLVPMPYPAQEVRESSLDLRYDPRLSAFTAPGAGLAPGERYSSHALVTRTSAAELDAGATPPAPELIALPANVPPEVGQLARDIVAARGATTRLTQALAIQDELQTWTYSLDVPPSHSGSAMSAFIESRSGYCEQYAGTMAVMLRTLGIPARVAVGFTPGEPDDPSAAALGEPTTYNVSLANAHAWVEVQFGDYGWIPFEPTPRSDGNVLVPTSVDLAPRATRGQYAAIAAGQLPPAQNPNVDDNLSGRDEQLPQLPPAPTAEEDASRGGVGGTVLVVALALLVLVGALVAVLLLRRRPEDRPPLERVLRARERVGWLGAGLGVRERASETDDEYLRRLVHTRIDGHATRAATAADLLARRVGQARWAPALPDGAAQVAEAAAEVLEQELTLDLSRTRRLGVRLRAAAARTRDALRLRPRRPAPPPAAPPAPPTQAPAREDALAGH